MFFFRIKKLCIEYCGTIVIQSDLSSGTLYQYMYVSMYTDIHDICKTTALSWNFLIISHSNQANITCSYTN